MRQVQAFFTHRISSKAEALSMPVTCDDDASVASTVTAVSHLSFESQEQDVAFPSHISSFSSKKSVHFDESHNEAYDNTQICREDCEELWYNGQELCQFKESTYLYGEEVCASEKRCGGGGPCSYERVVKRVYLACCQTTEDTDKSVLTVSISRHLNRWMSSSSAVNRLGIERLIVRQIRKDRSHRRKEVVRAVLEIQELGNLNQFITNNNDNVANLMCTASQSLSLPSRLFSRHMAEAQASATETNNNM